MTETEALDAAARALYGSDGYTGWSGLGEAYKAGYRRQAETAIRAYLAAVPSPLAEALEVIRPFAAVEFPKFQIGQSDQFKPWHGIPLTMGDFRAARHYGAPFEICQEAAATIASLTAKLAEVERERDRLIEDRARFPDRPDDIGRMIGCHFGNLRAGKRAADEHAHRAFNRATAAEARIAGLEAALAKCIEIADHAVDHYKGCVAVKMKREITLHVRAALASGGGHGR